MRHCLPDAVFLGRQRPAAARNFDAGCPPESKARICVSAIALETLQEAVRCLEGLGYRADITQISVSRGKSVGQLHLLLAQNPVF